MALTDLTQKILADADTVVVQHNASAVEAVAHIERKVAEDVAKLQSEYTARTEELRARERTLLTERAQAEARAQVESAQRDLLNDTYRRTLADVVNLPDGEYVRYIEGALKQVAAITNERIQKVYAPLRRIQVTKDVCARVGLAVSVDARDDVQGGFVAVGEFSEYDARLEQKMLQVQRASESTVARILFTA